MAQALFNFPQGFLWGTASASHQNEGNNTNNNWWAWENEPDRIIDGKKSDLACDWWGGRWREDFDRAVDSGQNAHRLSIEWSRVQTAPDRWDESALDRYREIVRGLLERGMTPMVTLHHFSDPIWLTELNGWENEAVIGYFETYVSKVIDALKEYVNLWITINEPNVLVAYSYLFGSFPPGERDMLAAIRVMTNHVRAHAAAYHTIHSQQPTARVGIATNYTPIMPARRRSPLDRLIAGVQSNLFNEFIPRALTSGVLRFPLWFKRIPAAKNTQDFLGINYYTREYVSFNIRKAKELFGRRFLSPDAEHSDTGYLANEPEGIFDAIKWGLKFKLPIMITENGIDDAEDRLRPRYLVQHLHQVWRAVNFNYPVKGYFHWTLVDNFEWDRGWTQRFGLWALDNDTQARLKRPSADLYAEICRQNGISSEIVERFTPEIYDRLFPD
jgi:beta-glucosidase